MPHPRSGPLGAHHAIERQSGVGTGPIRSIAKPRPIARASLARILQILIARPPSPRSDREEQDDMLEWMRGLRESGPEREGDVAHSQASIEKAKTLLGYNPQYDINSGLKEAISWYWNNLK